VGYEKLQIIAARTGWQHRGNLKLQRPNWPRRS